MLNENSLTSSEARKLAGQVILALMLSDQTVQFTKSNELNSYPLYSAIGSLRQKQRERTLWRSERTEGNGI